MLTPPSALWTREEPRLRGGGRQETAAGWVYSLQFSEPATLRDIGAGSDLLTVNRELSTVNCVTRITYPRGPLSQARTLSGRFGRSGTRPWSSREHYFWPSSVSPLVPVTGTRQL